MNIHQARKIKICIAMSFSAATKRKLALQPHHVPNPEDLWAWMDGLREKGMHTIAVPHNSNGSNGLMFMTNKWDGSPMDTDYARTRMRNEPIVEMTQVKEIVKPTHCFRRMMNLPILKPCRFALGHGRKPARWFYVRRLICAASKWLRKAKAIPIALV